MRTVGTFIINEFMLKLYSENYKMKDLIKLHQIYELPGSRSALCQPLKSLGIWISSENQR